MSSSKPFWQTTSLLDMTHQQWESVCDGCAKCCLTQLQDEQTEQLVFTDVACDLLDDGRCQCTDYQNRSTRVPGCLTMNKENVMQAAEFAPPSCSYRLLLENKSLPDWHHLQSGDVNMVHETGNSVRHRVRFERDVVDQDYEQFVVDWPERWS